MKFLHLSDLHIGKTVNGFPMLGEQRHVFQQIIRYVQSMRPDAVVIAGDIYDRAVPGTEAVQVFDDFLTALAGEGSAALLVSGNHDSPERLSYASRLLQDKRLFLYGAFDGGLRKTVLNDQYGEISFWLLPFIKPPAAQGFPALRGIEDYGGLLAAVIGNAGIDYSARNVLVSHQFFTAAGILPVRSESEQDPVGGLDAVDAGIIGRFDYAALGHLHGAQTVGAEHIRYSGSPLKYSFSEVRQRKSATFVELREKGSLTVEELPLTPVHGMREIKGTLGKLLSPAPAQLDGKEDYLRVILTDEEEIVDPMGKIRSVYPNVMSLEFENSRTMVDLAGIDPSGADNGPAEAAQASPYDLFRGFFREAAGSGMSPEQEKIAKKLFEEGEDG